MICLPRFDRASMKYGLEVRVPILDYRIVEFAINLHSKLKMHGNVQKYMLKETLADYLPRNLFARPKWGFSLPMQLWLNNELNTWWTII
jgi:asparagine synthase (glutamine-hydrolysing)